MKRSNSIPKHSKVTHGVLLEGKGVFPGCTVRASRASAGLVEEKAPTPACGSLTQWHQRVAGGRGGAHTQARIVDQGHRSAGSGHSKEQVKFSFINEVCCLCRLMSRPKSRPNSSSFSKRNAKEWPKQRPSKPQDRSCLRFESERQQERQRQQEKQGG